MRKKKTTSPHSIAGIYDTGVPERKYLVISNAVSIEADTPRYVAAYFDAQGKAALRELTREEAKKSGKLVKYEALPIKVRVAILNKFSTTTSGEPPVFASALHFHLSDVTSKRGAPMGRSNDPTLEGKVFLRMMKMIDGGYDEGGAYWGCGSRETGYMYIAEDQDFNQHFLRATSRENAVFQLYKKYGDAIKIHNDAVMVS